MLIKTFPSFHPSFLPSSHNQMSDADIATDKNVLKDHNIQRQWRSRGYCRPGSNIYGVVKIHLRAKFAPLKRNRPGRPPAYFHPPLLRHCPEEMVQQNYELLYKSVSTFFRIVNKIRYFCSTKEHCLELFTIYSTNVNLTTCTLGLVSFS